MNLALEAANIVLGLCALALMPGTLRWRETIDAEPQLRGRDPSESPGRRSWNGLGRQEYDANSEAGSSSRVQPTPSSRMRSER